jgi:hypothetical protein
MALSIDIPPELEARLAAQAQAEGVSVEAYLRRMLERELESKQDRTRPYKSLYGALSRFGPGPSAEDIDANRADMFGGFARGDE